MCLNNMKAFPVSDKFEREDLKGMDLRDYFAAKAMQAVIPISLNGIADETLTVEDVVISAYEWADLMMMVRNS